MGNSPYIKVNQGASEEEKMELIKRINDCFDYVKIELVKSKGKIIQIHFHGDIFYGKKESG